MDFGINPGLLRTLSVLQRSFLTKVNLAFGPASLFLLSLARTLMVGPHANGNCKGGEGTFLYHQHQFVINTFEAPLLLLKIVKTGTLGPTSGQPQFAQFGGGAPHSHILFTHCTNLESGGGPPNGP